MRELLRYLRKILMHAALFPLRALPLKGNRVLLLNDVGLTYADNPKYVARELHRRAPGRYELVIPVRRPERYAALQQSGARVIRYRSLPYFYLAMTAKVFLTNNGGYSYLPLRRAQRVIQTWHGGGASKVTGLAAYDTPLYRRDLRLSAEKTDVVLSTCRRSSRCLSESLMIPQEKFWEIGMPRNDLLVRRDVALRESVRARLGLGGEERLVLFAPTFRRANGGYLDERVAVDYGMEPETVCAALERRFGAVWRFGCRLHPAASRCALPAGVMDLCDYDDMQELLLAADVLITDFSSSMWDYLLTGKPCFLYAADWEEYLRTTQVYEPVSHWPPAGAVDMAELAKNIIAFDEADYAARCRAYYAALGGCETGRAAELVCDRIEEYCAE